MVTKVVALLLIVGLLLPSAMQARQLVDFCMMEMMSHHHEMMDDSHDCCQPDEIPSHSSHPDSHECENGSICACSADETPVKDSATAPVSGSTAVLFPKSGFKFMVTSPDEFIHKRYFAFANPDSPPLYLLYDTFLN